MVVLTHEHIAGRIDGDLIAAQGNAGVGYRNIDIGFVRVVDETNGTRTFDDGLTEGNSQVVSRRTNPVVGRAESRDGWASSINS